jgi:hypothetical protein
MSAQRFLQRVAFRFGLTGVRWGIPDRPVVLVLQDSACAPQLAGSIASLVAAGRQVIALDPVSDAQGEAAVMQSAMALSEAAVEIRNLEAVIGQGEIAGGGVALALAQGLDARCAVLIAPGATTLDLHDVESALVIRDRADAATAKQVAEFITGKVALAA